MMGCPGHPPGSGIWLWEEDGRRTPLRTQQEFELMVACLKDTAALTVGGSVRTLREFPGKGSKEQKEVVNPMDSLLSGLLAHI